MCAAPRGLERSLRFTRRATPPGDGLTGNYFLHCQYLLMMMPMMMARGLDDSALLLSFTLIHLRWITEDMFSYCCQNRIPAQPHARLIAGLPAPRT